MPVTYVWLLCCYSNTTARRIGIYQIRHTAYKKIAPEDGLMQSETCRAYIEKLSLITRILCILLVKYILQDDARFIQYQTTFHLQVYEHTYWHCIHPRVLTLNCINVTWSATNTFINTIISSVNAFFFKFLTRNNTTFNKTGKYSKSYWNISP